MVIKMIYRPNKKDTKQIENLNEGYALVKKGMELILRNAPRNDGDVSVYTYRAKKNIDKIIQRVAKLLEAQYVTDEFINIVKNFKINDKRKK
jgi:hypothetical protein